MLTACGCAKKDGFAAVVGAAVSAVLTTCGFAKADDLAPVTAAAVPAVLPTDALATTCQGAAVAAQVAAIVDWKPTGLLVAHCHHLLLRPHDGMQMHTAY